MNVKRLTPVRGASLVERLLKAEDAIKQALNAAFPPELPVRVRIRSGQHNLSPAVVLGAAGGRYLYVRVRLLNAKPNGRCSVRDVAVSDIFYESGAT